MQDNILGCSGNTSFDHMPNTKNSQGQAKTDKLNKKKGKYNRGKVTGGRKWGMTLIHEGETYKIKQEMTERKLQTMMKPSSQLPEAKSDVLKYLVMCDHQSET